MAMTKVTTSTRRLDAAHPGQLLEPFCCANAAVNSGILSLERRDLLAMSGLSGAILEEIARELELRPLLTRILTRACGLLEADDGVIGLHVSHRNTVQVEGMHGQPAIELGREFRSGEGLLGRVLETGHAVFAEGYGGFDRVQRHGCVIGVPIHDSSSGLLAVLGIEARPPRKVNDNDLDMLGMFARHAAIAIHNAMRYEREKRRTERMTLIARVSSIMTAGLDANELAATAAQVIHEHLGYPNVVIPLLCRDAEDHLLFQDHAGRNAGKDPRYEPPPPVNALTALAVPIVLGDEVFGCINIEGLNRFDEDDVASIQIIADHLAVAIKNVSLSREARKAAVMRERQRLARDLHDAVSQALSSISLMSQSMVTAWRRDSAEGERRARRIEELARLAFAEMRALLRELRPDSPRDPAPSTADASGVVDANKMGLAAALQRFACILAPQTPSISLDFSAYRPQPPAIEERLYLICREALSNAVRHSGADRLDVSSTVSGDRLTLQVKDNGRGFNVAAWAAALADSSVQGIGLQTMNERAAALGGVCEIQSRPGLGTTVCIRIQLLATPR